jgi:hypothetical protein
MSCSNIIFPVKTFPLAEKNREPNMEDAAKRSASHTTGAGFVEKFLIEYPDWRHAESDNPYSIITLRNDTCWFELVKTEIPLVYYLEAVKEYVREKGGSIILEERAPEHLLVYETVENGHLILTKAKAVRCEDQSFVAFFICPKSMYDNDMETRIFQSIMCERSWSAPSRENKKLGLVINPKDAQSFKNFNNAFNLARDFHTQVSHQFVQWGNVELFRGEYDWKAEDFLHELMLDKGLEVSTVFSIIHTSVRGKMPGDMSFKGWDDPELARRFSDFVLTYLNRYRETVRYVEIGNEINIYFLSHPEELESYTLFYKKVIDAVEEKFPQIKTGTVFAYHVLKKERQERMYRALSYGDFDSFTLYIHGSRFEFSRDPAELFDWLEEIEQLTGNRKYALEEVGWSTASSLMASQQDQAEAVDAFFDYLEQAPARLEYMSWFLLHDWSWDEGVQQAGTFFADPDKALEKSAAMDAFITFLITLGLIDKNGNPKDGWYTWAERARNYYSKPD